jgi:hypothetical protein
MQGMKLNTFIFVKLTAMKLKENLDKLNNLGIK